MSCRLIGVVVCLALAGGVFAKEPELVIQGVKEKVVLKRSDLLKRKDLTVVETSEDPIALGKKVKYSAVPVYGILESLTFPEGYTLHYVCADGFAASIPLSLLRNRSQKKSVAYIAIEKENEKWPPIEAGKPGNAGPFYLIWQNPKASGLTRESWPYNLVAFEVRQYMQSMYPNIFPDSKLPEKHPVKKGLEVFTKNCFPCHTVNLQGDGKLGPDLNVPMNPTEYFHLSALKTLIRDPQKLRHFPEGKMHPFPKEILPDGELSDLLAYLKHMSKKKVKVTQAGH